MLDSVLRVFGKDFDVDAFLKQYPLSIPAEPYSKGEPDLLGNPNIDSGFDALVSERIEPEENLAHVRVFLESSTEAFEALKAMGMTCIIDIGCTVDAQEQCAQSINIPVDIMALCCQLNVSIEFSAYSSVAAI